MRPASISASHPVGPAALNTSEASGSTPARPSSVSNAAWTWKCPLKVLRGDLRSPDIGRLSHYATAYGPGWKALTGMDVLNITNVSEVSASTLYSLRVADRALRHSKELLFQGASNQWGDIWRTNACVVNARRERLLAPDGMSLKAIIASSSGNCGEHARVTQAVILTEPTQQPLMRVRAKDIDHNFVILGDPRELPDHEIVVADSWVTLPMAHLLSQGQFKVGDIIEQCPPQAQGAPLAIPSQTALLRQMKPGSDLAVKHLQAMENQGQDVYTVHSSLSQLGQAYQERHGKAVFFDGYPHEWIVSRINLMRWAQSLTQNTRYCEDPIPAPSPAAPQVYRGKRRSAP